MFDLELHLKAIMFGILKDILVTECNGSTSARKIELDSSVKCINGQIPLSISTILFYYDMKFIKCNNGIDAFVIFDKNTLKKQKNIPPIFTNQSLALFKGNNGSIYLSLGESKYDSKLCIIKQSTEIDSSFLEIHLKRDLDKLFEDFNLMYYEVHN